MTAPWLIAELFQFAGAAADHGLALVPVNPLCWILFPYWSRFAYTGGSERMASAARRFGRDCPTLPGTVGSCGRPSQYWPMGPRNSVTSRFSGSAI